MKRLLLLLVLTNFSAQAQGLLQTFGSGTNQFQIEFVTIGNPGNAADTTGSPNPVGSVGYVYNIGKYEISRDMITKASAAGSLGITLQDMTSYGGNGLLRPATGITWYEAATFVNWLNTNTGNQAAYKFSGSTFQLWTSADAGYQASNPYRNSLAKFWLPSMDEWYKAAYGSPSGLWFNYSNGSNTAPTAVANGTAANTAVFGRSVSSGPADITNAGGLSAYETMGQGGNVTEWVETAGDRINDTASENRALRGGAWVALASNLDAASTSSGSPTAQSQEVGFRIAGVPEPSSASLVILGLAAVLARSRRGRGQV